MTAEVWAMVRELVESALQLPIEDRAGYLRSQSPDNETYEQAAQLVGFEQEADQIFAIESRSWGFEAFPVEASLSGRIIGNYRLIEELGRGGMGAVYLAERADGAYQQRVALKILQESIYTPKLAERFAEERQILARLSHPGIARLLDGGVTPDGRPYLVLEYVEGRPIDVYCEAGKLDTAARLRLFLEVAEAVQSAHQQLVLHLDLKPANILVKSDGRPHLLDFGISRVLGEGQGGSAQAEATVRLLTPRYASPEQAAGEPLGVPSDVFSLATLLYKLLTGRLPYTVEGESPLEAARIIREEPPLLASEAAPIQLAATLRGDIDTILAQALRKEPSRRYATVLALAEDIRQHLASKPVSAHADSLGYRAGKFARRNRGYLVAAVVALLVAIASISAVIRSAIVARKAREVAERRLKDERELAHSYIFDLDPMLQEIPGSVPVRVFILKHALKYLDTMSQESIGDDDLAREVGNGYIRIGQIQADAAVPSMNDRPGAWDSMSRGFALDSRLLERNVADLRNRGLLVRQSYLMGSLALDDGDLTRSEQFTRKAWELGQPLLVAGPKAPRYATMIDVAWALANNQAGNGGSWSFADPAAALPWLDKMIDLSDRYHGALPATAKNKADAAESLGREAMTRASALDQLGRHDEARTAYEQAFHLAKEEAGENLIESEVLLVTSYNYADFLIRMHETAAAAGMSPPIPPPLAMTAANRSEVSQRADILGQHARIDLENGNVPAGRREMQESLDIFERLYRSDPEDANSMGELASTCFDLAREQALGTDTRVRLFRRGLELLQPFERAHPEVLSATLMLGRAELGLAQIAAQSGNAIVLREEAGAAADKYAKVLAAHPAQVEARHSLSQAQQLLGQ